MFKKILIGVVVLIGGFIAFAATRPDTFKVERSAIIKAKPEKIFNQINDFHNWVSWSPWEKMDPEMKRTYSGEKKGKGAEYKWEGKKDVGSGGMMITESASPSRIVLNLDFIKPFEAHNIIEFTIEANKDSSRVIWTMSGKNNFISKLISIFISMDKMVGKDFEAGLENLKTVAEK
jgi:hypothetical protein